MSYIDLSSLPPLKEDYVRWAHICDPSNFQSILSGGLNYSGQGMISSTARPIGNIRQMEIPTDPRFNAPGYKVIFYDIPWQESRMHNDPTRSPGVIPTKYYVGVLEIPRDNARQASILEHRSSVKNPDLWEGRDLRPGVQRLLLRGFLDAALDAGWTTPDAWAHLYLVGSQTTYQYSDESDLDVTVVIDLDKYRQFEESHTSDEEITDDVYQVVEKLNKNESVVDLPPIKYYVQDKLHVASDGIYDLTENKWVREPEQSDEQYDPQQYWQEVWREAQTLARSWDVKGGNIKRDIIDFTYLRKLMQRLSDTDVTQLKFRAIAQEGKILAEIIDMVDDYQEIRQRRMEVLSAPDDPENVYNAMKAWVPENVLYKILERYGYIQFMRELKELSDERFINDNVLDDIKRLMTFNTTHASKDDPGDARRDVRKYLKQLYGKDKHVYTVYIKELTKRFDGGRK